jgi:hypothetical protein
MISLLLVGWEQIVQAFDATLEIPEPSTAGKYDYR